MAYAQGVIDLAAAVRARILAKHEVEFIMSADGGCSPWHAREQLDLDVVYELGATNIERLLQALDELQAVVRDDPRSCA